MRRAKAETDLLELQTWIGVFEKQAHVREAACLSPFMQLRDQAT
jgi:hypothetical protein